MSAPIVYRSDDGNAPVISGHDRTCVVNVLNKCLVTGYGEKPAAGWTMPFVNASGTIGVFRPNPAAGTGFYLQADQESPSESRLIKYRAYEQMSSQTVGVLPIGETQDANARTSDTTTAGARSWVCVATDTWVLFIIYGGNASMPSATTIGSSGANLFFGDFERIYPSDAYNCSFLCGEPYPGTGGGSSSFGWCATWGTTNAWHRIARGISGASGGVNAGCHGPYLVGAYSSFGAEYGSMAAPPDGGVFVTKIYLGDTSVRIRGFLPGIYASYIAHPWENLEQVTIGDDAYIYVMFKQGNVNNPTQTRAGLLVRLT